MYRCLKCKKELHKAGDVIKCESCGEEYKIVQGISLLLDKIEQDKDSLKQSEMKHYENVCKQLCNNNVSKFVTFLNYGYVKNENPQFSDIQIGEKLLNRKHIKLLLEAIGKVNINKKTILEVGCGRGGNIKTIQKYFKPNKIVGLDLSLDNLKFCKENQRDEKVEFVLGDAELLPFVDNSFDALINIESSDKYGNVREFYKEVYRVLKKGGAFLYVTILPKKQFEEDTGFLKSIGFTVLREQDITSNILLSCDELVDENNYAYGKDGDGGLRFLEDYYPSHDSDIYYKLKEGIYQYKILNMIK